MESKKRPTGLFNHNKLQKKAQFLTWKDYMEISRTPKEKLLRSKQKIHRRKKNSRI